jgi:hypothetical protein
VNASGTVPESLRNSSGTVPDLACARATRALIREQGSRGAGEQGEKNSPTRSFITVRSVTRKAGDDE